MDTAYRYLAALTLLTLAACSPGYPRPLLWAGYQPPTEASLYPAIAAPPCPRVGLQNLSAAEAAVAKSAIDDLCRVIASPAFAAEIQGRDWLATCGKDRSGNRDVIAGEDVYRLYTTGIAPFSLRFRKPVNAVASTQIFQERIAIRKRRLADWSSGDPARMGETINTLAHEMTHMVWNDARDGFRFQDQGHQGDTCPDTDILLVSYGLGNAAERVWKASLIIN